MTLPELPPLRRYDLCLRGYENTMKRADDGDYCDNDDREARESILLAEIERLRAEVEAMRGALLAIFGVVVDQNRRGTSWHPEVFPRMMDALGLCQQQIGKEELDAAIDAARKA